VEYARQLLEEIGLEGRRLQMINVSSAMGGQFAWSASEITEEIRRIGPSPLNNSGGRHPESEPAPSLSSELDGG
jgi:coenzyme F420-reducing hydrogenase delta subunit